MPKKDNRLKRNTMQVPQNLGEATKFLGNIGEMKREIEEIKNGLNREVEELKNQATKKIEPLVANIQSLFEGLYAYAESRRSELTNNGKIKTVSVVSGDFGWRITPPAVSIKNVEKVLKELRAQGLSDFIRIKEEVNKEAILADPEIALEVPGVKITRQEEFFAKPSDVAEMASLSSRLKRLIG